MKALFDLPPDAEIAQKTELKPITEIAHSLGLTEDQLEPYGRYKAKVHLDAENPAKKGEAKVVLVSAMTATRFGDGKTVTSIGLGQGLSAIGKSNCICLRQPSLGPTFGIKGGAAGGGHSQVLPMEDINMHLTGDFHAVTSAHNLLAAVIDNHMNFGNDLNLDPERIVWRRVIDLCDRQLRQVEAGLGGKSNGFPHPTGFDITASSEVMAVLALSKDRKDLKERLGRMVVAYTEEGEIVRAEQMGCIGAMEVLLKDTLMPTLVQTTDATPCLIHAGPFANIAHGCNSIIATTMATRLADYVVTEAGFAADLGAEKFLHIKSRELGFAPAAVVLVVTARALKLHGGADENNLKQEDVAALKAGFENVQTHVENLSKFGIPTVVAINRFSQDTPAELEAIKEACQTIGARFAVSEVAHFGGEGGKDLAKAVVEAAEGGNKPLKPLYKLEDSLKSKIETLAREVYRADGVDYADGVEEQLKDLEEKGFGKLPICMAKTQKSLSDKSKLLGAPKGWRLKVRRVKVSAGAGFIVVLTGKMLLMPGMPKEGSFNNIHLDENEQVVGLS